MVADLKLSRHLHIAVRRAVTCAQANFMRNDKGSGAEAVAAEAVAAERMREAAVAAERMREAAVAAACLIALAALVSAAMPLRVGRLVRPQDAAQPSASIWGALVRARIHNKLSSRCGPNSLIRLFSTVSPCCALIASHAQRRPVRELIEEHNDLMASPAAAAAPVLLSLCLQLWAAALMLL